MLAMDVSENLRFPSKSNQIGRKAMATPDSKEVAGTMLKSHLCEGFLPKECENRVATSPRTRKGVEGLVSTRVSTLNLQYNHVNMRHHKSATG